MSTNVCVQSHRGDSLTLQSGNVCATAWMDRRVVMAMSTGCDPLAVGSVQRREKDGSRVPVRCPESIILYNQYMGGVDRGDQKRGYYHCRTKSHKFYKYIFKFLLDVSITNTYILQCDSGTSSFSNIKEFRIELGKMLIGDYSSRRRPGRSGGVIRPLPLRHFPIKIKHPANEKLHKRGRCERCKARHKRVDSVWWCQECGVWLCHTGDSESDCFLIWHTTRIREE